MAFDEDGREGGWGPYQKRGDDSIIMHLVSEKDIDSKID